MNSEITVQEMEDLILKVEEFYKTMGNPKMGINFLAEQITKRLKSDRDYILCIEGLKGTGKSNFALLLALMMAKYNGLYKSKVSGQVVKAVGRTKPMDKDKWDRLSVDFDFDKNFSFLDDAKQIKKKFFATSRFGALVLDEGSKALHKYKWSDKLQQMLVGLSDSERWQNKATIICIPNFRELTTTFRNDRIRMRIYIYKRDDVNNYASGVIGVRDPGRWSIDPWYLDDNFKIYEHILRKYSFSDRTTSRIQFAESKLKGYVGTIHFPSIKTLAPSIWDKYFNYKVKYAMAQNNEEEDIEAEESKRITKWRYALKMVIAELKRTNPKITWTELSRLTSVSVSAVKRAYEQVYNMNDSDITSKIPQEEQKEPMN